jgi:hypothetical protein
MPEGNRYLATENVLTAHIEGEAVLLHVGTKNYHTLNPTAAFIWKQVERGATREAVVEAICERFEVEQAEAEAALERLLRQLEDRQLIVLGDDGRITVR